MANGTKVEGESVEERESTELLHVFGEQSKSDEPLSVDEATFRKSLGFEEQEGLLPGEVYYEKDRPHWQERYSCVLAMVGFAVGLSNIYRFSHLCVKHGGLAFLIPYTFFVVGFALPLVYLEVIVGQFTQSGMIRMWTRLVPIMRGVGWYQCLLPLLITFYNSAFLAWALHFCLISLTTKPLPWIGCDHNWNTLDCRDIPPDFEQVNMTSTQLRAGAEYFRGRVQLRWKSKFAEDHNMSSPKHIDHKDQFGLGKDNSESLGIPRIELFLYLLAVYVVMYYFIHSGLRFEGKGIWITVTAPYVVVMILIYRGIILPGAVDGLRHLLSFPDKSWKNLAMYQTWVEAAEQVFFSLGTGGGVHLGLASYNKFTNNVFRDAVATVVIDTGTSFLCSIVVFIALGSIAKSDGSKMKDLFAQGPDLLFEVCSDFWARLPGGGFFTSIFFFMVFIIGFECLVEALTCTKEALFEAFGAWFDKNGKSRWVFVNTMLVLAYLVGLLCLARGGHHVVMVLETSTPRVPFLVCSLLLVIGMAWFWGLKELCNAADAMTGRRPNIYFQVTWKYLLPIVITIVLILQTSGGLDASYYDRNKKIVFKSGIQTFGQVYAYAPLLVIILGAVVHMIGGEGVPWKKRFLMGISPNYTHKDILETGTCNRSKASHYFYCYDRSKLTTPVVHPEPPATASLENNEIPPSSLEATPIPT